VTVSAPAVTALSPGAVDERAGRPAPVAVGLLHRLLAAVRPEFRTDVLVCAGEAFHPGRPACRVPGCDRASHRMRGLQLCRGHQCRWQLEDRPPLAEWTLRTAPRTAGRDELASCAVRTCGHARRAHGMCPRHSYQWERAGRPDKVTWLATVTVPVEQAGPRCAAPECMLLAEPDTRFCYRHHCRWRGRGRPSLEEFVAWCADYAAPRLQLGELSGQLKLEVQFALQQRVHERRLQTDSDLATAMPFLAATGVSSLLDKPRDEWFATTRRMRSRNAAAFILNTWDQVESFSRAAGWDGEYERDMWDLRRLGYPARTQGDGRNLRFDRIPQRWLRELAKRWIRHRLSSELALGTVRKDLTAVTALAESLAAAPHPPGNVEEVTRQHLESHLAHVRTSQHHPGAAKRLIGPLVVLLDTIRRAGWGDLPTTTQLYREDFPRPATRLPRGVAEHVMAQIESPENMALWAHDEDRLITRLIIETGRRVGEACALRIDCLRHDSASRAAYLRYYNQKMRREAYCPISDDLAAGLSAQVERVRARWPAGDRALFPKTQGNPDGVVPITTGSFRYRMGRWLAACRIEERPGVPAYLTPHQWRHTFAIRLVDRDVPLQVVQRLLDHDSLLMTQHYGRVSDTKTRHEWERARKVDADGTLVTLDPAEELADTAYVAHKLAQARHALPNGYCRLSSAKPCEYVNPCFTCPLFVTTHFLGQHRRHRAQIAKKLDRNLAAGRTRAAEKNRTDLTRLDRIIATLQTPDTTHADGVPEPNLITDTESG